MSKRRWKIIAWISSGVLACLVIGGALFWFNYMVGFGAPRHPGYVGYKPTYLPNDLKIRDQVLSRDHTAGTDIYEFSYQILLTKDFSFTELQKFPDEPTKVTCQGYGNICNVYTSARGKTYRVWYGEYRGKVFGMEADWVTGNTDVMLRVTDAAASKYLGYDWSPIIDGMQKVDLSQMRFTQLNHTNSGG